jgi:hypothetical protein
MTPTDIDPKVLTQRAAWILEMIGALRDLPLKNKGEFLQNRHNVAAAESFRKQLKEQEAKKLAAEYEEAAVEIRRINQELEGTISDGLN